MKLNIEPLKAWFGYSRRERRSATILVMIIVAIVLFRSFAPDKKTTISEFQIPASEKELSLTGRIVKTGVKSFDPNIAPLDTLLKAGLNPKNAATLIKYREKGGRFKKPEDIRKIYGLNDSDAARIISSVEIKAEGVSGNRDTTYFQKKSKIELNSSDTIMLDRLPGIGAVLSVRIVKYRNLLGGFVSVEQLKEVYGLSEETYTLIRDRLSVDTLLIKKIAINNVDYRTLSRFPYFDKSEVSAILKYRELKGRLNVISDLTENKLIKPEKAYKIRPYLRFD
jgi:competence protein ComEA